MIHTSQVEELRRLVVRMGGTPPAAARPPDAARRQSAGRAQEGQRSKSTAGAGAGAAHAGVAVLGVGVGGVGLGVEADSVSGSLNLDAHNALDATYTEPFDKEDMGMGMGMGDGAYVAYEGHAGLGVGVSVDASSLSAAEDAYVEGHVEGDEGETYETYTHEDEERVPSGGEDEGPLLGGGFDAKWAAYVQQLAPSTASLRRKVNPLDAMIPRIPSIGRGGGFGSRPMGTWDTDVEASYVHPDQDEEPDDEEEAGEEEAFQYRLNRLTHTPTQGTSSTSRAAPISTKTGAQRVGSMAHSAMAASSNTSSMQYQHQHRSGFSPHTAQPMSGMSAFGSRIHAAHSGTQTYTHTHTHTRTHGPTPPLLTTYPLTLPPTNYQSPYLPTYPHTRRGPLCRLRERVHTGHRSALPLAAILSMCNGR
jgi:hypothetical protein